MVELELAAHWRSGRGSNHADDEDYFLRGLRQRYSREWGRSSVTARDHRSLSLSPPSTNSGNRIRAHLPASTTDYCRGFIMATAHGA
jgi:hypothetical protein